MFDILTILSHIWDGVIIGLFGRQTIEASDFCYINDNPPDKAITLYVDMDSSALKMKIKELIKEPFSVLHEMDGGLVLGEWRNISKYEFFYRISCSASGISSTCMLEVFSPYFHYDSTYIAKINSFIERFGLDAYAKK